MQPVEDKGEWLGVDVSGRQPVVRQSTPSVGHNSRQLELDKIVAEAVRGLKFVEKGEAKVIEGWLIYGAALNVGREKFDGHLEFGKWVALCQLDTTDRHDRSAAMWAEENTDLMYEIMEENPRIKTVRGAHAKYKLTLKEEEEDDTEDDLPSDGVVGDNDDTPDTNDTPPDDNVGIGGGTSDTPNTDPIVHNVSMIASCFLGVRTNLMLHKSVNNIDGVSDYDLASAIAFETQKHYEDEEMEEVLRELKDLALQLSRAADITLTETDHNVVAFNSK